jgi:arabinan endo-1,5-alpha-L-arabinosidase
MPPRTTFPILLALTTPTLAQTPPPTTRPTTRPFNQPATTLPADPATIAQLAKLGARNLRLHDPSAVLKFKDTYYCFSTGPGVPTYTSKDLLTWERGPRALPDPPNWIRQTIPANRNGNDFWAPDIIHLGDRFLLYYSVSTFGKNTSAIGLATNTTLDSTDPNYKWIDQGVVVRSTAGQDNFNAIDPAPFLDADGRLYLAFGSFWSGIKLVELNPTTGLRLTPDSPIHALAQNAQIEGPYLFRHADHYYLMVAWGWCCRGTSSTYIIRVGRADKITGPYLDRTGEDMLQGGGTLLLGTTGPLIGPGQPSLFTDDHGASNLVFHFYDPTQRGRGTLGIRPLTWDKDNWPTLAAP